MVDMGDDRKIADMLHVLAAISAHRVRRKKQQGRDINRALKINC